MQKIEYQCEVSTNSMKLIMQTIMKGNHVSTSV